MAITRATQLFVEALGSSEPVAEVARKVGYESASAFVAAFRRETGITPANTSNRTLLMWVRWPLQPRLKSKRDAVFRVGFLFAGQHEVVGEFREELGALKVGSETREEELIRASQ